jgi:hypothetical protein
MKPWWMNVKFVVAVLSELLSLAVLILSAASIPLPVIEQVQAIAALVLQLVALVLGTWWGAEVGERRALQ